MKPVLLLAAIASFLGALACAAPAFASGAKPAQPPRSAAPAPASTSNAGLGQQIANTGGGEGVAACASCHGAKGEGNAQAGFPRLAAQSQPYLARQMAAFANGSRNHPIMTPIAKAMSAAQIEAVSGYYATLDAPWSKPAGGAAAAVERGRVLAARGDESLQVQACANCHGPGGRGEPPTYPYLAGQHTPYLVTSMGEWKSKARNTDASGQMPSIAARLSDADVAALAAYYGSMQAPSAAALRTASPAGTPARPVPATPSGAGGPANAQPQGVGTEQGAPTTGGSQGPGGGGGTQSGNPASR